MIEELNLNEIGVIATPVNLILYNELATKNLEFRLECLGKIQRLIEAEILRTRLESKGFLGGKL